MSGPTAPAGGSSRAWVLRAVAGGAAAALLAVAAGLAWFAAPAWRLFGAVAAASSAAPSHLYARSLVLRPGEAVGRERVRQELDAAAYREEDRAAAPDAGAFRPVPGGFLVHLRRFPGPRGGDGGGLLDVRFAGGLVVRLERDGAVVDEASLEPVLLATYAGDARVDRRPLAAGALPEPLVHAVLAAEDDGFFSHPGVSPAAIARAAWADLRAGAVVQGGSTVTQQLVKNLALSDERTLGRKLREAVLAGLLEQRFSKNEILRAYLDTVYLGSHDGVGLVGVGAAARAYFGNDPDQLSLAEAATLAGMIAAPARASPIAHPGRARSRRDWVLGRMAGLGYVAAGAAQAAAAAPVATAPAPVAPARAPYFAEAARLEARARAGDRPLERAGLALLSTLDWRDQEAAEAAVRGGLAGVERRSPPKAAPLEAALVSLDPRDGAVLAYVGGRDWSASQFDRVADAHRQAGSAFKPIVYATAFALGVASPASILDDEPLAVPAGGELWQPRDDDGEFRGPLSARAALETSRNLPAVRLALAVGLEAVIATARAMGVTSALEPVPSLSLGAAALTPRELATVYATLAAGGVRPPVHLLAAAVGPDGRPRRLAPLPPAERALPAPVAFLVTDVLRGVLDRGTGAAARALGVADPLAGKTGTTNGGRDAWFAGYSPDRVTVAWVGRDDDAPAGLSGARAALPVWSRFTRSVRPPGGYPPFVEPGGLVRALVDPTSGELATTRCPDVVAELFLAGHAPRATCHLHGGWLALPVAQGDGVPTERPGFFRRLLAGLFGRHASKN
jgi:penicillin-binding protein 1B